MYTEIEFKDEPLFLAGCLEGWLRWKCDYVREFAQLIARCNKADPSFHEREFIDQYSYKITGEFLDSVKLLCKDPTISKELAERFTRTIKSFIESQYPSARGEDAIYLCIRSGVVGAIEATSGDPAFSSRDVSN